MSVEIGVLEDRIALVAVLVFVTLGALLNQVLVH